LTAEPPGAGRVLEEVTFPDVDVQFLMDLRGWLNGPLHGFPPPLVRNVAIVLGELMTNAYRHAGPPFGTRLSVPPAGCVVRVAVSDGTIARPGWQLGRGLLIVRDVCVDWGVEHRPDGKVTWAEVPVPRLYV
jgi:anti-sigma regulatory factor (Ser/Thr protein kinase)